MLKKIRGKIENNPIYKFRQFWNSLSTVEQSYIWDILTALRGEDKGDEQVKVNTTARIRAEFFNDDYCSRLALFKSHPIHEDLIPHIKNFFTTANPHFRGHIHFAVIALTEYVYKKRINDLYKVIGLDRS